MTDHLARRAVPPVFVGLLIAAALLALGGPAVGQVAEVEELTFPPLRTVEVPQPTRVVLDNGLTVMLIEDHELPLVEARALVATGSQWEPAELAGLAGLTGDQMRSGGTAALPSDALDDLLEDRAAIVESSIGLATGTVEMSCLVQDLPEILRIFSDVLRRPAFEEQKLAVAKGQLEAGIARQNDSAPGIAGREIRKRIYGPDSPLTSTPTYATVRAIDRPDLVAWHARSFQPQNVILGLVGDFATADALRLVREVFGDWPRGETVRPRPTAVTEPAPGLFFVEKADVNQSYLRLAHLGIKKDHPRYFAVEVLNEVLGGSLASRMFSNVRSKKGLGYDAHGAVGSGWDIPGIFSLSLSTKTETTAAGIDALLEEARGLTANPLTEAEVTRAKQSILAQFVFNSDSVAKVLGQQMTLAYHGYPADWLERYRSGIEAVTVDEVRAAAAEVVHPEKLVILVVGRRDGVDRPLSSFGEVVELDVTIPEPPTEAGTREKAGVTP